MKPPISIAKGLCLAAVMIVVAWLGYTYLVADTSSAPPLPNPNGYADFVQAVRVMKVTSFPQTPRELNASELRLLVATNAESLRLIRLGLTRECRISTGFGPDYINVQMPVITGFKASARLLAAESRLAEIEGRTNDAVRISLDAMRFGQESLRGGVLIERLVGLACEAVGRSALEPLVPKLDAAQCRDAVQALEAMEARRETPDEVMRNEREWVRQAVSPFARMAGSLAMMIKERSLDPRKSLRTSLTQKINANDLQRRRLLVELASRAFELEQGRRPKTVSELVARYLRHPPPDALAGPRLF